MAEVASAYVSLLPSARGFGSSAERQIGPQMDGAAKRTGGRFGKVFATASMSPIRAIGTAALGLFALDKVKDAFSFGLDVASQNEQARISFTTMLGSAQKAQAFLGKMQKFAAATPFEFPELQSAASSLISVGIDANKVIPIMTTLGDVTAGMGTGSEGIKRATVALQQMSAAGRITGEDLNQLRDAGVPVYDLLSAATGKTKAEVVALAQAGKLGSKELGQLFKALQTGKGLERFNGLMDKQSHSLAGMVSTFKDTFGQGLAKAIQPLIPLIKDGLAAASTQLAAALPKVQAGMRSFVQGVRDGTGPGGVLVTVLTTLKSAFTTLAPVVIQVVQFLAANKGPVAAFAGVILTVATAVKIYTIAQTALNFVLTANPIGIVAVALAALAAGLVYAYQKSETFRAVVNAVFGFMRTAVAATIGFVTAHWKTIVVIIGGPIAAAAILVAKNWNRIKSAVSGAISAVIGFIKGNWQSILATMIAGPFGLAVSLVVKHWGRIKAAVSDGVSKVVSFVKTLPGKILAALGSLGSLLFGAGMDMIRGLINGIKAMASSAASAAADVARGAVNAVKGALKIHSPSKVMHGLGKWTVQGLANGIVDHKPKAIQAALGMAKGIQKVILDRLQAMRDGVAKHLSGLKGQFKQLRDSVAQSFAGDLFNVSSDSGAWGANIAASFASGLKSKVGDLKALKAAFTKLRGWGVPAGFLTQLFASGNGDLALALAGGTRAQALSDAKTFAQVNTLSKQLGTQVASSQYGKKIDLTNKELSEIKQALRSLPKSFGHEINKAGKHGHRKGGKK